MANKEHLDILTQGVEAWNRWRKEHPDIQPDLSKSDLIRANLTTVIPSPSRINWSWIDFLISVISGIDNLSIDLSRANLMEADLSGASFIGANFNKADLHGAVLEEADLSGTNLSEARLTRAKIAGANLSRANLSEANLTEADLSGTNLSGANLHGADLSQAYALWSIFADIDLRSVKGLEMMVYGGPVSIGIDTIYRSQGNIPEVFLKGAGMDDTFITYIRSLVGKAIEYYSCFISYSSKDDVFAKRLHADLQSNNVRCWFAPEDLKWGEKNRHGIDEAIRLHDKLLLILSKQSVASGWVEHEVKTALAKERKEKRTVLFPVRVDKAVLESPFSWATEIRHERNIGERD
ncbi:MAG: toll/interleukin-1 receptor domain-containing protein [Chloroflexi bacterium]|nr:MAG: toll/interleukin-1 receptor domain-containing protein [Chloroflexota bacterium]